jgi:hypothetical protein
MPGLGHSGAAGLFLGDSLPSSSPQPSSQPSTRAAVAFLPGAGVAAAAVAGTGTGAWAAAASGAWGAAGAAGCCCCCCCLSCGSVHWPSSSSRSKSQPLPAVAMSAAAAGACCCAPPCDLSGSRSCGTGGTPAAAAALDAATSELLRAGVRSGVGPGSGQSSSSCTSKSLRSLKSLIALVPVKLGWECETPSSRLSERRPRKLLKGEEGALRALPAGLPMRISRPAEGQVRLLDRQARSPHWNLRQFTSQVVLRCATRSTERSSLGFLALSLRYI